MTRAEQDRLLRLGKTCLCGQRAVKHDNAGWVCAGCMAKEKKFYFATRARRGDVGTRRMVDAYTVGLIGF